MTKYAAFSTLTYSTHAIRPALLFSAVMFLGFALGAGKTVSAQQVARITVSVGETKSNSLKQPVDATDLQITIQRPAIAKASYDPSTKRFNFEGLSEGQTRVTIVGTYPNPKAGGGGGGITGRLQQNAVPYRHLVDVTVVPRAPDPNANAFRRSGSPGRARPRAA